MKQQSPIDTVIELSKDLKRMESSMDCPIPCESRDESPNSVISMMGYLSGAVSTYPGHGGMKCSRGYNFKDCQKYKDHYTSLRDQAAELLRNQAP
jgi:hypothetical protein